jgi:hypothetical protein
MIPDMTMLGNAMTTLPSLNLKIIDTVLPVLPSIDDSSVTVWRDRHGVLGALSHLHEGERWLHVINLASFKLDLEQGEVIAIPAEDVPHELVEDEFQRTVWPTALQLQGWEVLHGSAIQTAKGIVAFCALSETGKSTIAYALGERGHPLWADDAVLLSISPEKIIASTMPFQVRLRPASASYFGHAASESDSLFGRVRREGKKSQEQSFLKAVCLLEKLPDESQDTLTITEISATEALPELLKHAIYFSSQDKGRKREMMQHYLSLAMRVPIFRVGFRHGFDKLPAILDGLEQHVICP